MTSIPEDVKSGFDAWYTEAEGYAVRAERLTTSRAELEAAYAAGAAAERERCALLVFNMGEEMGARASTRHIASSIRSQSLSDKE